MNDLIIAKFGGTSMGTAEAMRQSARIVIANNRIRVVVVSATSGTTNALLKVYHDLCACDTVSADQALKKIEDRHRTMCHALELDSSAVDELIVAAQNHMSLFSASENREVWLDAWLSFGERLASRIFGKMLFHLKNNVTEADARSFIITDEVFGKAEPQPDRIKTACLKKLLPLCGEQVIVTQGFIGATTDGRTTTLGRGGSDYSAALLGEALSAKEVLIWTDVPGIFTMDPNLVPAAQTIPKISFSEAAELANFGAKVLHPATLWPAIRKGIHVFVGSTFEPEAGGTWIEPDVNDKPLVRAIAMRKHQTLITVSSLRMLNTHGFLAKMFGVLADHKLSVDLVTTSEVSVALTIDGTSLGSSGEKISEKQELLQDLRRFADVAIEENLTLIALVGNNLQQTPGIAARTFDAIAGLNVRLICQGASSYNMCFLMHQSDAPQAVSALHRAFIESEVVCLKSA
ncbi:MAG TPA: lysine-sensitive aspartokinase 3 [bacterium]|nr:lysine-sensitive aspartokinase 3 [bacterium]